MVYKHYKEWQSQLFVSAITKFFVLIGASTSVMSEAMKNIIGLIREGKKTKEWGKGVWKVKGGEKEPQHSF